MGKEPKESVGTAASAGRVERSPDVVFDGSVPAYYDRYLGPVLFESHARDLAARVTAPGVGRVLELACGTGRLTRALRAALPESAELVATDLNEPMLRHARAAASSVHAWAVADAEALPFADASFDRVVCQFGLMFVPHLAVAFVEVRRVLRATGALAFSVFGPMAANDLAHVAHTTVARLFPEDPPAFYEVPFRLARAEEVLGPLAEAGFEVVSADVVRHVGESPSARDAALGLVYGNPILAAIRQRGSVSPDAVVDAIARDVAAACGDAPVRARTEAMVYTARPTSG